jgi:hypothetical protein
MSGSLDGVTNPHAIPLSAFTDIAKQVESYKLAALQAPTNDFAGPANKSDEGSQARPLSPLERMISERFLRESSGGNSGDARSSARYAMSSLPGQGAAALSDPAFLRSMGLNGPVAGALAAMGFTTQAQVQQVVNDTRRLGLEPKAAAIDLGKLRKAEGPRTDQHVDRLAQYRQTLERLEEQRRAAEKETDAKKKAESLRQIETQRREAKEELNKYRNEHVKTPEGKKAFDAIDKKIEMSVEQSRLQRGAAPASAQPAPGQPARPNGAAPKGKKAEADQEARVAAIAAAAIANTRQEAEKQRRLVAEAARSVKGDAVVQERTKAIAALDDFAPAPLAGAPTQPVRQAQAGPTSGNSPAATPPNGNPATAKVEQPKGATPEKPQNKAVAQNTKAAGPAAAA